MKTSVIVTLIGSIIRLLTPNLIEEYALLTIDFVEEKIMDTEMKIDNMVILPITKLIRKLLEKPDKVA